MNSLFLLGEKTFIKDIIHDTIELSPIAKSIIDSNIFQRLRNLHQLGVCYLIFPNANNNRFEHSIGTYHLAGLILEKIIKNSSHIEINNSLLEVKFIKNYLLKHFELDDTDENISFLLNINTVLLDDYLIELIKIAGLVHDIGHGPFSHLFDEWLHSIKSNNLDSDNLKNQNSHNIGNFDFFKHESRSVLLFKEITKNKKIILNQEQFLMSDIINDDALQFISELINPSEFSPKHNFIFQIISNTLNGLDVDKLDYLYRDCFYLGFGTPYDLSRIISYIQVINKNICFPEKVSYDIYKIFRTRYDLHKQFYTHKTTICIDYMIRDILKYLDPVLNISDCIQNFDINKFISLNDYTILNSCDLLKNINDVYSKWKHQIDNVVEITNKINNRKLYKCIYNETFFIHENISTDELFNKFKLKYNEQVTNINLSSPDIIIVKLKIGLLGGNNSHPLDNIYFYDNKNKSLLLDKTKISHLMSSLHQEVIYYIISK